VMIYASPKNGRTFTFACSTANGGLWRLLHVSFGVS